MRKITQDARALLSTFYEDRPTIARAIREGVFDRKHERALKALSFVMEQRVSSQSSGCDRGSSQAEPIYGDAPLVSRSLSRRSR